MKSNHKKSNDMAITRNIGERFELNGKTLEVRECRQWYSCQGCDFHDHGHPSSACYTNECAMLELTGECSGAVRTDKKYVVFKAVK